MKKFKELFLIFVLLFIMGCSEETTIETTTQGPFTVNLYLSDGTFNETHDMIANTMLDLPMIHTDEEHIYVGWSDGETVYSGSISITKDLELLLVQELVSEVFVLGDFLMDYDTIPIIEYTGSARYLTIPETINNYHVTSLQSESFAGSDLIEIYIPNSVKNVYDSAFEGSSSLEKVVFYGDAYGVGKSIIPKENFDDYMSENSELCSIVSEDEDGLINYAEGCRYLTSKASEVVIIGGVSYQSFTVTFKNSNYYEIYEQNLRDNAFKDCISLETIIMPKGGRLVFKDAFENTPSLLNIEFNHLQEMYQVIDGVIYDSTGERLVYYPGGLEETVFTIPNTVLTIEYSAFYSNTYLQEIIIHADVEEIYVGALLNLPALSKITVEEGNVDYYSSNGVLYYLDFSKTALLSYPPNREGTSFTLPEEVDYISGFAFVFNKNIETLDLGSTITSIHQGAFMKTEKLRVLDLPSSVEFLNSGLAFDSSIEILIIRRSVVTDGDITRQIGYIFREKLQAQIYVQDDSIEDYLIAHNWNYYSESIHPLSEYTDE